MRTLTVITAAVLHDGGSCKEIGAANVEMAFIGCIFVKLSLPGIQNSVLLRGSR